MCCCRIGIVALLVAGIVVPLTVIGARERRPPTTAPKPSWVEATVHALGSLPAVGRDAAGRRSRSLIPVLGLRAGDAAPRSRATRSTGPNQSSAADQERAHAGGGGRLRDHARRVRAEPTRRWPANGVFTDQMGAFQMDLVERSMADNPELAQASSLATTVGWLDRGAGHHAAAADRARHAAGVQAGPDHAAAAAGRRRRQRRAGAVPGRSVLAGGARSVVLDDVEAAIADPGDGGAAARERHRHARRPGRRRCRACSRTSRPTAPSSPSCAVLLVAAFVDPALPRPGPRRCSR